MRLYAFKNIARLRLVYYSIYDVADFLLNGETTPSKDIPEPQGATPLSKKKPGKVTAQVQDLSHIFMLRTFAQSLEKRATANTLIGRELEELCQQERINGELPE